MKRVLVFGDCHCGHAVGLTSPRYQWAAKRDGRGKDLTKHGKFAAIQAECWFAYQKVLRELEPIDRAIFMGDAIDGRGERSGGTELITTDREEQCNMAVAVCDEIRLHAAKGYRVRGVRGTDYHVAGGGEDWENIVAERAGFESIGAHDWPRVEGVTFDAKHHLGSSAVPHGRATATLRDMLWNELWAVQEHQPRADVLLRAHVHFAQGVWQPDMSGHDRWGFTVPALQALGSRYGALRCSGTVHWGLMHFDCDKGRVVDWGAHIMPIRAQQKGATAF